LSNHLISVLLGIVEGLTEFLPVSSTAHLKLAEQWLVGPDANVTGGFWDMYTIVIQLGAILALPVFFAPRIRKFVRTFPKGERGDRTVLTHPLSLVMIAFVVTAVPMFLLSHFKIIDKNLDDLRVIGSALLIGGVVMWAVDALCTHPRITHVEQMGLFQSVWIGAWQILSGAFPGTSRSMSTIAGGQTAGMSRASALEFSFFLSMPTMTAATLYSLYKWLRPKDAAGHHIPHPHIEAWQWTALIIGFVVSFIVALAVVAWFMGWVRKRGFAPFAIYRIIVGIAVLVAVRMGKLG
jgi:undecaprenyl-diphosphatase